MLNNKQFKKLAVSIALYFSATVFTGMVQAGPITLFDAGSSVSISTNFNSVEVDIAVIDESITAAGDIIDASISGSSTQTVDASIGQDVSVETFVNGSAGPGSGEVDGFRIVEGILFVENTEVNTQLTGLLTFNINFFAEVLAEMVDEEAMAASFVFIGDLVNDIDLYDDFIELNSVDGSERQTVVDTITVDIDLAFGEFAEFVIEVDASGFLSRIAPPVVDVNAPGMLAVFLTVFAFLSYRKRMY